MSQSNYIYHDMSHITHQVSHITYNTFLETLLAEEYNAAIKNNLAPPPTIGVNMFIVAGGPLKASLTEIQSQGRLKTGVGMISIANEQKTLI